MYRAGTEKAALSLQGGNLQAPRLAQHYRLLRLCIETDQLLFIFFTPMPYSFTLLYSVILLMPRILAASL